MGVMLMSTTCFAAGTGTSAVTQPLDNLKTLTSKAFGLQKEAEMDNEKKQVTYNSSITGETQVTA